MEESEDPLANAMADLFVNLSSMVKSELQGTNNQLELLEKMNARVAEEYSWFGDVASGLRVFVEQLSSKSGGFNDYVQEIDAIERKVADFEAVVSLLDKHVTLLESKRKTANPAMVQHAHRLADALSKYNNNLKTRLTED